MARPPTPHSNDPTPPTLELDVHELENGTGITSVSDQCCQIRRAIQPAKVLLVLASGSDPESGVAVVETVATIIQRCRGVDSLGIKRDGMFETEVQIVATAAPVGHPQHAEDQVRQLDLAEP